MHFKTWKRLICHQLFIGYLIIFVPKTNKQKQNECTNMSDLEINPRIFNIFSVILQVIL